MINQSIAEKAIGEFVEDLSTPDPYRELLKDPEARLVYLIELEPYNPSQENKLLGDAPISVNAIGEFDFSVIGGVQKQYFASERFITEPTDSPANQVYLPLTDNPYTFDVSILNGEEFRGGSPSFGAIRLLIGDGDLDYLTQYFWEGRVISVYAGADTFSRGQFAKIFNGVCSRIEWNEDQLIISIQDKTRLLDTEFTQNIYEGEGGLSGNTDIKNSPKPLLYGECLNISPVLVDATNLIYQIHDGSMESVDAVFDKGIELSNGGDVADIVSATVGGGQFKTQLSGGYIKLGSSPEGSITINAKGENLGGYKSQAPDIISYLVQKKLGAKGFSTADLELGSFNRFSDSRPYTVGIYLTDSTTARVIIDSLIVPLQGYWVFSREGRLTLGVIEPPSVPSLKFDGSDIIEISLIGKLPPSWRYNLGYARNWTVQNKDSLASAVLADYETFASEVYRIATTENRNNRTKTASLKEVSFESLLTYEADAINLIEKIEEIYGNDRSHFRIVISGLLLKAFIGDVTNIKVNRFGLNEGKNLLITAISENAETNQTTFEVWG